MKKKINLEGSINYHLLPAKVSQQVLMLLTKNMKGFFCAMADYKKHPDKYKSPPCFPHFLERDGYFLLIFTNQQAVIKPNGTIKLTKELQVDIPEKEFEKYRQYFIKAEDKKMLPVFAQIRIVPKLDASFFHVEIVYDKPELNSNVDANRVASIDLGVNNLITLVDSEMGEENRTPIIVNGRPIKSVNIIIKNVLRFSKN
jgi:transposase